MTGEKTAVRHVISHFYTIAPALANVEHKEAAVSEHAFLRMKVRLKKEIVRLKHPEINPNNQVGTYIPAVHWNELISRDDVKLVDTRTAFEVTMGTFEGAINPETMAFHEFPEFVAQNLNPNEDKHVALFCTGGIRCEKATSYLLEQGFENVYHLHGGILKYLEQINPENSLWNGECFVFDKRISVVHGQERGSYSQEEQLRLELQWKQELLDKRAAAANEEE